MKKSLMRVLAVLLALAPLTLAVACDSGDNSANGTPPNHQETPSEETPGEEDPSEEKPTEEEPTEENPTEEEKPSLPGGLVDGGNFESNH